MSRNVDFVEAASDINEQVTVIRDPQLVSTIQKWLSKLTAENRGSNELSYLKLLQYMVSGKKIGRPFVRPPPAGPLLPLSRYLNPPPSCDDFQSPRAIDSWRTISCSKSALKIHDNYDNDTDDTELGTAKGDSCSGATLLSTTDNENESTNRTYTTDTCSSGTVSSTDDQLTIVPDTRLHLSGGAENNGSCWGERTIKQANVSKGRESCKLENKRPIKTFPFRPCDPCIDDLGNHLKKPLPGPIDEAYKDIAGNCVLPKFTEAEQKSVGPELLRVLEDVSDLTTLQDFYFQVGGGKTVGILDLILKIRDFFIRLLIN